MADKYMQLVLTPSVQQAQVKYFGQRTIRTALGSSCSATLACSTRVRIPSSLNDSPPEPLRSKVERLFLIQVISYDWNCPQYFTPRFTAGEMEKYAAPLKARIAELEAQLAASRWNKSGGDIQSALGSNRSRYGENAGK